METLTSFFVGIERDAFGRFISNGQQLLEQAVHEGTRRFGGITAIATTGGWKDNKTGVIVVERGARLDVLGVFPDHDLHLFAEWLRDHLRQASVLVTASEVRAEFVGE